jgi:hypothetical protein
MSWCRHHLNRFLRDARGTIAIITALILPGLLLAVLGGTTAMKAMTQKRELQSIAQAACNRALKPQRLVILDDAARQTRAQDLFDKLAAERGFVITSRTATAGWLTGQIDAATTIEVLPGFNQTAIPITVSEVCAGIPPYPARGDVILSSHFKTPSGTSVDLPNKNHSNGLTSPWGVFSAAAVGWDGHGGWGVEIQDWSKGFGLDGHGVVQLPAGSSNKFVVELDSGRVPSETRGVPPAATCGFKEPGFNSSMYKNFELHPGTYRFSLWHFPRVLQTQDKSSAGLPNTPANSSNRIAVYLEGTRPVIAKALKLEMPKAPLPLPTELLPVWTKRSFDIDIATYGLYRLTVAAEGCNDGRGGLFNDLKLEYIRRPRPEYDDPTPPAPTN